MPKQQRNLSARLSAAALVSMTALGHPAWAGLTQDVEDALNFYHYGHNGAVKFDLNYRYENANQDAGPLDPATALPVETANANTARLRLGYLTPAFHDFQGYAEYEGNLVMQEDYNSTRNFNTAYSTIADPNLSELNQFWVTYKGLADTVFKVGRQRIKLDDDRFIGNVGWRQMETTYDAVLLTHQNQTLFGLTVNAGYVGTVQTFTGTTEHVEAPLLNVNYKLGDFGNAVGYGYWLDYTDINEPALMEKSSQTYGLRVTCCAKPLDSYKLSDNFGVVYTAEYSHQSDYGHGAIAYDADRYNVMGGVSAYNVIFSGAMEQLDGTGAGKTFDTPLGTNHAFQGWADVFLQTPANGIRDVSGTITVPLQRGEVVLTGVYHEFSDDTGRFDYGNEWDFQATKKFGKHYSLLAKYAVYNSGDTSFPSTDTQKLWLQGNISF